jgi:predicted Zn-dependent protease
MGHAPAPSPFHPAARSAALACGLALALASSGCEMGGNQAGPGRRSQTLGLTPQQEAQLGKQAFDEVLKKEGGHVLRTGPQVDRIRRVGQNIERAVKLEPLMREINLNEKGYSFAWEYVVLDHPNVVNAFCLPGGYVAVYTGLLNFVQSDDELATVMGHEIAHALAHHASERIARQQKTERALEVLAHGVGGLSEQQKKELFGLLSAGASFGQLAYDRQQESEADHIGLFLMTFAGYDPDQAVAFWERMKRLSDEQGHPPEVLSDHPSDARRIAQLRQWAVSAKAALHAYRQGRIAPQR